MFNDLQKLLTSMGIEINDKALENPFIHRSYLNEARDKQLESNERLEFLGDSVLSLVVSHHLYLRYPELPEGQLTNYRSSVVKTTSLALASKELELGQYLKMAKGELEGGGQSNPTLLADTYEAVLGLIYLETGYSNAKTFVERTLLTRLEEIVASGSYRDFKSMFQEKVQEKYRMSPTYTVVNSYGPDHAKTFEVEVSVQGESYGKGSGKSKQEAEQQAARNGLDAWK